MNKLDDAQFLIKKLLVREEAELAARDRWVWERDRWHELVVAIVLASTTEPEYRVRMLVNELVELDLLDTSLQKRDPGRIRSLLVEEGVNPDEAERASKAIASAFAVLESKYGGKIALCLREHGTRLLNALAGEFKLTGLDRRSAHDALVFWVQNVLSLPLSRSTEDMESFCAQHGVTKDELIAAADGLDLNLGLLDDLISLHQARTPVALRKQKRRRSLSRR